MLPIAWSDLKFKLDCRRPHAEALGIVRVRIGAAKPASRGQTLFLRVGDALKRTVLPALTLIFSPVLGFSGVRALVFRTVNVPKLGRVNSPSFFVHRLQISKVGKCPGKRQRHSNSRHAGNDQRSAGRLVRACFLGDPGCEPVLLSDAQAG